MEGSMSENRDEQISQRKFYQRPLFWLGLVITGILLITASITRLEVMASSSSQHPQDAHGVLAVITNSGSTNSPGSQLIIYNDGSGSLTFQQRTWQQPSIQYVNKTFPPGTFDSSQLARILAQIHDVSTVPGHGCFKSISFGSSTTITHNEKTSGDISCTSGADEPLFQDLRNLVQHLYTQATGLWF
jgi:hypothetical protein